MADANIFLYQFGMGNLEFDMYYTYPLGILELTAGAESILPLENTGEDGDGFTIKPYVIITLKF